MSNARGYANAQPPGRDKIANAPPPGLTTKQMPHGCPGGGGVGWAPLELTDALKRHLMFAWDGACVSTSVLNLARNRLAYDGAMRVPISSVLRLGFL